MIKLQLLDRNPLTLQPLLAKELGLFDKYDLDVEITLIDKLPRFNMDEVTANVGDVTRIFNLIHDGIEMVVTSTLTKTMKMIIVNDYQERAKLHIISATTQSLGIYASEVIETLGIDAYLDDYGNLQERLEALENNRVDGACMIAPFLNKFINDGYKVVFDGKNHESNFTCWAFKKSFATNNREKVLNFHQALNEAGDYFNKLSKQERLEIAKKHLKVAQWDEEMYLNFEFDRDYEYSFQDLEKCFKWLKTKDSKFNDFDYSNIIMKWS